MSLYFNGSKYMHVILPELFFLLLLFWFVLYAKMLLTKYSVSLLMFFFKYVGDDTEII